MFQSICKGIITWARIASAYMDIPDEKTVIMAKAKALNPLVFSSNLSFRYSGTEKQSNVATLGPSSVTYYWGLSVQKDFVYLLYSGRTPIEVIEEKKSATYYIYVEQFDWNGNPIRKFKLDRWGYFYVDDKEENIYLASSDDEHPLYSFKIPQQ